MHKTIVETINIPNCKLYVGLYFIGDITADAPIINNILNMFDPIIFPIAISESCFIAAVTLVTNSGKLVPIAIIVKLIIFSLMLNIRASFSELSTTKSPPNFNATIPNNT